MALVTKTIDLNEEQQAKLQQMEASIHHWSAEHTQASLKVAQLLNSVATLYESRSNYLETIMKELNIDVPSVKQAKINGTSVQLMIDDSVENPA